VLPCLPLAYSLCQEDRYWVCLVWLFESNQSNKQKQTN
jgi:hypothetical protein